MWLDRRTNYTRSLAVMSMVGRRPPATDRRDEVGVPARMSCHGLFTGDCFWRRPAISWGSETDTHRISCWTGTPERYFTLTSATASKLPCTERSSLRGCAAAALLSPQECALPQAQVLLRTA